MRNEISAPGKRLIPAIRQTCAVCSAVLGPGHWYSCSIECWVVWNTQFEVELMRKRNEL